VDVVRARKALADEMQMFLDGIGFDSPD